METNALRFENYEITHDFEDISVNEAVKEYNHSLNILNRELNKTSRFKDYIKHQQEKLKHTY